MAYFYRKEPQFLGQVHTALANHFGKRAQIITDDGVIKVRIKEGFPGYVDGLTPEEQEAGVCGGGIIECLDGDTFVLRLDKADTLDV